MLDGLSTAANLNFSVAETQELFVSILSQANIVVWEKALAAGEYSITLPHGMYFFSCSEAMIGAWDQQPFYLGPHGLNYGVLSPQSACRGTIFGEVKTVDAKPVPHAVIVARSEDGYRTARVFTEQDGRFQITGLAIGEYVVSCDARAALGRKEYVSEREVLIQSEDARVELFFGVDLEADVEVTLPNRAQHTDEGFLVESGLIQRSLVDAAGTFRVQPKSQSGVVGACFTQSPGTMEFIGYELAAAQSTIDLSTAVQSKRTTVLRISEKADRGRFRARFELNGWRLGQWMVDKQGSLAVSFTPIAGIKLRIKHDDGRSELVDLLSEEFVSVGATVSESEDWIRVTGEGLERSAACSVFLECCDVRWRIPMGVPFETSCGRGQHSLYADAPGFLSLRRTVADGETVTLVKSAAVRTVDCSQAAPGARWVHISSLASDEFTARVQITSTGMANLPELAAGAYKLTLLSDSGGVLTEKSVVLAVTGESRITF